MTLALGRPVPQSQENADGTDEEPDDLEAADGHHTAQEHDRDQHRGRGEGDRVAGRRSREGRCERTDHRAPGAVGRQVGKVAKALRITGENLSDTLAGPYIAKAANALDQMSGSIRGANLGDTLRSTESFARREPLLFLGGAFAVGLLAARFLKSSAHRDDDDQDRLDAHGAPQLSNGYRDNMGGQNRQARRDRYKNRYTGQQGQRMQGGGQGGGVEQSRQAEQGHQGGSRGGSRNRGGSQGQGGQADQSQRSDYGAQDARTRSQGASGTVASNGQGEEGSNGADAGRDNGSGGSRKS
jgi:hypothetical protein